MYFGNWKPFRMQRENPFARPHTDKKARELFEAREIFTALILEEGEPESYIEFNDSYIGVFFLDDYYRAYLSYHFKEQENGKLFLSQAVYKEYEEETDNLEKTTHFFFEEDGTFKAKERDFVANTVGETKPKKVDVSVNWEPYPEFGKYESLLNEERISLA